MGSVFCLQTILLDDNVNTKFIYTSTALLCLFFISPTTPLSIGTLGLNHPPFGPRIKLNPSVDAQIKYFPFVHNNGSSDQISVVCNAPFSSSQQHYSLKYEKPPLFRIVAKCKPTTLLNSFPPSPHLAIASVITCIDCCCYHPWGIKCCLLVHGNILLICIPLLLLL